MKEIIADEKLVSFCGLYCGACRAYLTGRCKGCVLNEKASWCQVRKCCLINNYGSCADCKDFSLSKLCDCKKLNNFISKIFSFIFKSDRPAGIRKIAEAGKESFSEEMAKNKQQAIKKV